MKYASKLLTTALTFGLLSIGVQGQASAQTAQEFYKGKTIKAMSGYAADATLTQYAQITARYLEKYTGANVVVKSMPAAGGTAMRNYMMTAKPDGLTVVLVDHGPKMVSTAMFKQPGAKYDWTKFIPIGKAIAVSGLVGVAKDSPWKNPRDVGDAKVLYGESSPFFAGLFAEALGWKNMAYIPGFRGGDKAVAVKRNEIQMGMMGADSFNANPDVWVPLVAGGYEPAYPKVPKVRDVVLPGKEKWAGYIEDWNEIMDMGWAPPGTPKDRVAFLESALKQVWADAEFRAAIKKVGSEVEEKFITSEQLQKTMKKLADLPDAEIAEMNFVIFEKYKKK